MLTLKQLKNIKINLGSTDKCGNSSCPITVTLYDAFNSFFSVGAFNLITDNTLSGNASTTSPLKIAQQSATSGQVLTWNGTTWKPANPTNSVQLLTYGSGVFTLSGGGGTVNVSSLISSDTPNLLTTGTDLNLKVSIYKDATMSGNGTQASPLSIATQGATAGQVLTYNGSTWTPTTISGSIINGTALGQILYWDGSGWAVATPKKDVQSISSGAQVTLPFTPNTALPIDVYLNGVLKEVVSDYTISSNIITFVYDFATNDKITTKYFA